MFHRVGIAHASARHCTAESNSHTWHGMRTWHGSSRGSIQRASENAAHRGSSSLEVLYTHRDGHTRGLLKVLSEQKWPTVMLVHTLGTPCMHAGARPHAPRHRRNAQGISMLVRGSAVGVCTALMSSMNT